MHGNRIFLHHVFHFGYRRRRNHLFEREDTSQTFVVVNDIYIIDFVQLFRLLTHLFQTFGHTPVLVDEYHFRTHQTTGGIFVVFQQVDNVTCLFNVLDVRKNLFLLIFIEFTHQVYGIVRIHVVNEAFGDCLRRKHFEQFFTSVFVHFDKHVGGNFIIEQAIDEFSLFRIQVIAQFGNVGRMEVDEKTFYLVGVFLLNKVFNVVNVFLVHRCQLQITNYKIQFSAHCCPPIIGRCRLSLMLLPLYWSDR